MRAFRQYLRQRWFLLLLFLLGLCAAGNALRGLARTAIYVHEAILLPGEVVDVRQFPFPSAWEALSSGNLPWEAETAYQPIVRFVLPDGIVITRTMPDADNADYRCGEQVEVITPPHDPNQAHLHKWKFQWGGSCFLLTAGLLLAGLSWPFLRRPLLPSRQRKGRKPCLHPPSPSAATPLANNEAETLVLEAPPAEPKKRRSPRRKSSASSETSGCRRSKRKTTDASQEKKAAAPKTPRRRKKTGES